jgi:hypothetical protein
MDKLLYALRARVERCIGHLKEQRRIATRQDKTDSSFIGFVLIAVGTPITERPPHRTVRAEFPHTAPTLGV